MDGLDQADLRVLGTLVQEWSRSLDQAFDLGLQGLLRVALDHIHGLDMRLARLGRHAVELGLLLVLVQEVLALGDVSATLDERRDVSRATKQVLLGKLRANDICHGASFLM